MSELDKAKEAVKAASERGKSKRTEYRHKQKAAAKRANSQTIWSPQYNKDGTPGPQVALITCPIPEILFGGARGGGKALPLDEVVMTPSGYRPMGSLKVGDQVCGPEYIPTTVIGVYPQGVERVYQVTLIDGRTVRASAGHLWRCRIGNDDEFVVTTDYIRTLLDDAVEVSIPVVSLGLWVPINRITDAGLAETQCIKVERQDGLFVTNDGIITHNTDAALGAWMIHANKYGQYAKGMFIRRQFKQLEEVQNRCTMLFPKLGASYIKGEALWQFPNGATLKLRHLWDEADAESYQGHQYCVAAGTPVLMGDGTYQPIEEVAVGDLVMTLEGPKPVIATMPPRKSPCVLVEVFEASGEKVGEQIHPEDHPVLTTVSERTELPTTSSPEFPLSLDGCDSGGGSELHLFVDRDPACQNTLTDRGCPTYPETDRSSSSLSGTASLRLQRPAQWQSYTTLLDFSQGNPEGFGETQDDETDCIEFPSKPPAGRQLPPLSVPVVLHGHRPQSDVPSWHPSTRSHTQNKCSARLPEICQERTSALLDRLPLSVSEKSYQDHNEEHLADGDASCGRIDWRIAPNCLDDCYPSCRQCDERPHPLSGSDPASVPSLDDAPLCNPSCSNADGSGHKSEHSLPDASWYCHPYTGEHRKVHQPYRQGYAIVRPCEPHVVHDLSVADANHYITKCQLVNSNTYLAFEELTNWPTPGPMDKMRATLRSAHGVECKIICTANPGSSGHGWVKARYITPNPKGFTPIKDPETGAYRVFIPSRLSDNHALYENDPDYEKRLLASGNPALVKAWLHGDWDVIAGAFFEDVFNQEKHIIRPFSIPSGWRWRRSFDWGSAAPASLGIWAISDGSPVPEMGGFVFPRGSMIRVDEWYTVSHKNGNIEPNKGMRLTNLALGAGVGHRVDGRNFSGCVADPAIFSEHGRQSIYSEMQVGAREAGHNLYFNRADNNRVAGWQKVRDLLENAAADRPERPGMWAFETCIHFIRTVPILQRDDKKPDDIDTDQEDHCADEVRYMAMTGGRGVVEGAITGH